MNCTNVYGSFDPHFIDLLGFELCTKIVVLV